MSIRKWFDNRSFMSKTVVIYVICVALPMLSGIFYTYNRTKELLEEQAYSDMRQNIETIENSLNVTFQPYETILNTLRNQRMLNTLLNLDYTDLSYSDIAYYCKNNFDNVLVLYPSVGWLRVFSNNDTLPEDQFYFWNLEELDDTLITQIDREQRQMLSTGYMLKQGEPYIMLIANMNYYSSHTAKNYISLGLRQEEVARLLYQELAERNLYLLDQNGVVLASTDNSQTGNEYRELLASWENVEETDIQSMESSDGRELFCLKAGIDLNMTLLMTIDKANILREARKVPLRVMTVFLMVSLLAFLVMAAYSKRLAKRMYRIMGATEQIGNGEFGRLMDDMGKDEIGRIAGAVDQMNVQIGKLIEENYERQMKITMSEMNLLQEQINPHFLYNALSVISSLSMQEGAKRTVKSVRYLSEFYRMSLNRGKQFITVEQEVNLLQNYMKIQMLRFSDMLKISYDIKEEVLPYTTIKLILQPLVENAIQHGQKEETILTINVRAWMSEERLLFEVEDDGCGIEPEKLEKLRHELENEQEGFGLKNVDLRIKLNYGKEYGVKIYSEYGKGTKVRVEIPKTK